MELRQAWAALLDLSLVDSDAHNVVVGLSTQIDVSVRVFNSRSDYDTLMSTPCKSLSILQFKESLRLY